MSNSLDPDQDRHFVGPDLGPNCLQRLSADDPSKQRVKVDPRQTVKVNLIIMFCGQTWGELIVNANALLMHYFFQVIQGND